jgi:hypothetical protein
LTVALAVALSVSLTVSSIGSTIDNSLLASLIVAEEFALVTYTDMEREDKARQPIFLTEYEV